MNRRSRNYYQMTNPRYHLGKGEMGRQTLLIVGARRMESSSGVVRVLRLRATLSMTREENARFGFREKHHQRDDTVIRKCSSGVVLLDTTGQVHLVQSTIQQYTQNRGGDHEYCVLRLK